MHSAVEVAAANRNVEIGWGYLALRRVVVYKRFDIAVQAGRALGRPLTIVGDGPEREKVGAIAGPTIHFAGNSLMQCCVSNYSDKRVTRSRRERFRNAL